LTLSPVATQDLENKTDKAAEEINILTPFNYPGISENETEKAFW
jgi:hypothetical protein